MGMGLCVAVCAFVCCLACGGACLSRRVLCERGSPLVSGEHIQLYLGYSYLVPLTVSVQWDVA